MLPPKQQREDYAISRIINESGFLSLDNWYNSLVFSYRFHTKTSALYYRLGNRELIIKLQIMP
ncbi:MAG: hypothetical protein WA323_04615 [Candidatus Nitrosopolaris sp.]